MKTIVSRHDKRVRMWAFHLRKLRGCGHCQGEIFITHGS